MGQTSQQRASPTKVEEPFSFCPLGLVQFPGDDCRWGTGLRGEGTPTAMEEESAIQADRRCPWCGSDATSFVQRGYTGPTDEVDQYFTCSTCGKVTYELIAKTAREMRLGRFRAGGAYQDRVNHTRYHVNRVLKVGVNEYLVYLKPMTALDLEPVEAAR